MLTPREQQIADLVCEGLTNKQISFELGISVNVVKHHLTVIFQKTKVKNRIELKKFFDKNR